MAVFDFKTATPTASASNSGYFFGADSQSDSTPKIYNNTALRALLLGTTTSSISITAGKTLTVSNSITLAGTDSTTMTFPASSTTVAGLSIAQTFTATQTFARGTITDPAPVIDATVTWNDAADVFAGIRINVTNTASDASSKLIDAQSGGVSAFSVDPTGRAFIPGGTYTGLTTSGATALFGANCRLTSNSVLTWASGSTNPLSSVDLIVTRDSAGTLAQRNGVNGQTFAIYNTYTDASNYERGAVDWRTTSNWLRIGTSAAGTGTSRNMYLAPAGGIIGIAGTTSSFPALKRSSAALQCRLADDSAYAAFEALSLRIEQTPTAVGTGAKTISNAADSSTNLGHYFSLNLGGTTYYVPCGSVALT